MADPTRHRQPGLLAAWLLLLAVFVALRFDSSERTYFQVDDQVVVWLVDDAVNNGNWQPDWGRAENAAPEREGYFAAEAERTDIPHAHHYNFALHMMLSAAIIKPLRELGVTAPTITLLHHIALFWDAVSLLFLVLAARQLGSTTALAFTAALLYSVFPLAVQGSHYARPDALLTAMGSALLWLALAKTRLPQWLWLATSGLALGIATGGKASQLMLGIFPAITCCSVLLQAEQRHWRTLAAIAASGSALLLLVGLVLGLMFVAGDIHPRDFWLSLLSVQRYYEHPAPPDTLEHYSYLAQLLNIGDYFRATLGWPLLLAMLAGAFSLAQRADKLPLLLLTVPLLFFTAYFASVPAFFDRSFSALAAAIVLLAGCGLHAIIRAIPRLPAKPVCATLLAIAASWQPLQIQFHLQTDHLRHHHNDDRLAFQKALKERLSKKTGVDFWIKNIDRGDLFGRTLPEKPPKNPRIYVLEDLNDWNSREYRAELLANGFVQVAEFTGDFADMPTNSLITVHEAARFHYFVRRDEWPGDLP